jgi:hypothetical protein
MMFLSGMGFVIVASVLGGMGFIGSLPKRFFAYIWRRSAFLNPNLELTNFGWRRKA